MPVEQAPVRRFSQPRGRSLATALLLGACALLPRTSHAWECSRVQDNQGNSKGAALTWPNRELHYSFSRTGTTRLDNDVARDTVRQAFATWQQAQLRADVGDCAAGLPEGVPQQTDIVFVEDDLVDQDYVGFNSLEPNDNRSTIQFRDKIWPYPLTSADRTERMALTTVTFNKINGNIVDADIELNTFGYNFSTGDSNVVWDLLNIATHEVGHFLGFAHSKQEQSTMFSMASYGETLKRQLSCDDATILWFRYPAGAKANTCSPGNLNDACGFCAGPDQLTLRPEISLRRTDSGRGGCSCQSLDFGGQSMLGAFLALVFWRTRRRPFHL